MTERQLRDTWSVRICLVFIISLAVPETSSQKPEPSSKLTSRWPSWLLRWRCEVWRKEQLRNTGKMS